MISAFCYSDIGGRPHNEDSVRIKTLEDGRSIVVLADGLGGHGGGEIASSIAVDTLCDGWQGISSPALLSDLFQQAHRTILQQQTSTYKMKSTLVALSLTQGQADWAWVGDSRLYQFYNGALTYQTRDHSASQIAVMLGQIPPEQIRFHEDRSRIFRALGQDGGLTVDSGNLPLSPGNYAFLLCSDGFWEYVYESEMTATLAQASSPKDWVEKMRHILSTRIPGNNDNNTAAALWLTVPERS